MTERPIEELRASDAFRQSVLDKADWGLGNVPSWRGWAIMDAFLAGIDFTHAALTGSKREREIHMTSMSSIREKAAAGAYGEDSAIIGKMVGILMAAEFEKSWGPFICGTMGAVGSDGLHDGYLILPSLWRGCCVYRALQATKKPPLKRRLSLKRISLTRLVGAHPGFGFWSSSGLLGSRGSAIVATPHEGAPCAARSTRGSPVSSRDGVLDGVPHSAVAFMLAHHRCEQAQQNPQLVPQLAPGHATSPGNSSGPPSTVVIAAQISSKAASATIPRRPNCRRSRFPAAPPPDGRYC